MINQIFKKKTLIKYVKLDFYVGCFMKGQSQIFKVEHNKISQWFLLRML